MNNMVWSIFIGDNKNVNNSVNSTVCTFSKDFKGTGEKIEEDTHNENQNKIEKVRNFNSIIYLYQGIR